MMERRPPTREIGSGVSGVLTFALLAAFALLALLVVVMGARVYKTINDTAESTHASRTAMSYLIGKVRAGDEAGMIGVQSVDGADVLTLGGVYGGETYYTYIYYYDGGIREYFASAEQTFCADYGEEIVEAQALRISLDGSMLTISMTDATGEACGAQVCLTAAGEAEP